MGPRGADAPGVRGLTLIELLVVLVILGVLVGAVTLAFPDLGARRGEQALARVRALVELACERAVLSGRDVGIAVAHDALAFGHFRDGRFEQIPDSVGEALRPRRIERGLWLSLSVDGRTLALSDALPVRPQLACLSSGELTPFFLELANRDGGRWPRRAGASGRLDTEASDGR
jgi:prepilin-type N-terminal cleavage/methylation domain-containing protein